MICFHRSDKSCSFFFPSLFEIMPPFYQYFLRIVKSRYLNGADALGFGGGETYHFSHFHIFTQRSCISAVLSTQKGTRRQTVTCRGADHLVLSLFLQQYDGTKSASEQGRQCAPRWCGEELFGTGFKIAEVWFGKNSESPSLRRWENVISVERPGQRRLMDEVRAE